MQACIAATFQSERNCLLSTKLREYPPYALTCIQFSPCFVDYRSSVNKTSATTVPVSIKENVTP